MQLFILVCAATVTATAVEASIINNNPPRAHELTPAYTYTEYLTHFFKSYPSAEDYKRRSAIFQSNLQRILDHNSGRMDENGNVIKGYVMGVNQFTDMEDDEVKMGFRRDMHPAWRDQSNEKQSGVYKDEVSVTERKLGEISYTYSVS